ncbi:PIR Superfamily Protein [Plasmodium ovale wallikeri]|uniref:PIR Superfamily Protein n=1 Tax=Plasmodium ovale wallikeri TaxID=864142 RepID=A0A1A9AQL1_PLAOA|nr:PIR Superfamily Protein [Plasmodium ovale wallikeri]SBT58975.1 PIR Superfamily Protein [Plasmodium ovale wallikeri]
MATDITINDLPSEIFYKELKRNLDYDTLENYVKNYPGEEVINNWLPELKSKIEKYFSSKPKEFLQHNVKLCRDLNYFMCDIVQKIYSLNSNLNVMHTWGFDTKNYIKEYFNDKHDFNCSVNFEYLLYSPNMKLLDDFCEDSKFIKGKRSIIQNNDQCQSIFENMSTRKAKLKELRKTEERKNKFSKISVNCSMQDLDSIYEGITCASKTKHLAQSIGVDGVTTHANSHTSGEASRIDILPSLSEHPHEAHESSSELTENRTNAFFALIFLPILGILLFSSFLYKFTPFGTKFNEYFRKKKYIYINQDNDEINNFFTNTIKFKDTYSENMHHKISYQAVEN